MKSLSAVQVVRLHDFQIEQYGGVPGLEVFGEEAHPTLSAKAAAYLFHLVKNHAFHDANKRTALHATLVFLYLNGHQPRATDDELFALVLDCATDRLDKAALTVVLSTLLEPR